LWSSSRVNGHLPPVLIEEVFVSRRRKSLERYRYQPLKSIKQIRNRCIFRAWELGERMKVEVIDDPEKNV
jgi:hypothetical protein